MSTGRSRLSKFIAASAAAAVTLAGGVAQAGDRHRHAGVDYARVIDVQPLVERVRYREPVEECWEEPRRVGGSDRTGAMLIGGVLGAVVGNQFGSGSGRRVATVAGAVLGGAVGREAAGRDAHDHRDRVRYEQRCVVHEQSRVDERIRAYRVAYRYHGRDYVTELPYDPGPRLRVAIDARPL
jgi:uncharacterized protein YcfJ